MLYDDTSKSLEQTNSDVSVMDSKSETITANNSALRSHNNLKFGLW
jgi:hypothetical protein